MAKILASRTDEMSRREQANLQAVRGIAAQGMVLLENSGVLPLREKGKIALFGSGARRTIKGGTGSGDVNSRLVINVAQGLKEAGFEITTDRWLDEHDRLCEESWAAHNKWMKDLVAEKGMAALGEIFETRYLDPDGPEISPEDIASSGTDTAVYVLSRNSGEGSDRSAGRGDFELSEMEEKQLRTISGAYAKTVVVLNVGGVIDTKFFRNQPGIGALLLMSQGGCASG
jgi:beta-glucosidase